MTRPYQPVMRRHPSKGAYCRVDGRQVYLGPWGTPEADRRFAEVLDLWRAAHPDAARPGITVGELVLRYFEWVQAAGYSRSEVQTLHRVCRRILELGTHTDAESFGPAELIQIRSAMISAGADRKYIQATMTKVRGVFRWGAAEGLIQGTRLEALRAVRSPRRGEAAESEPVAPVADQLVEATIPHLPAVVADMVRVQRLTGMRPGEVCAMRWADIDTTGAVWIYRPRRHKTAHHGHTRTIVIGPRAQEVMRVHLTRDLTLPVFRRRSGRGWRGVEVYREDSYRRAITRACEAADLPRWTPNQLRHARATEIRRAHGIEPAQAVLGHANLRTTEVYAERDLAVAARIALASG